jgi:hypothetical protein
VVRSTAVITPGGALALSANNRAAQASPLTDETRAALIKSAEASCFDGQSKQEANKSRKPEMPHAFCYGFAEKPSFRMTMEKALASFGKPLAPTSDEERVMRAVFDNCRAVNFK